jgi:hypothetical protein
MCMNAHVHIIHSLELMLNDTKLNTSIHHPISLSEFYMIFNGKEKQGKIVLLLPRLYKYPLDAIGALLLSPQCRSRFKISFACTGSRLFFRCFFGFYESPRTLGNFFPFFHLPAARSCRLLKFQYHIW